jgi:hypothetical protein
MLYYVMKHSKQAQETCNIVRWQMLRTTRVIELFSDKILTEECRRTENTQSVISLLKHYLTMRGIHCNRGRENYLFQTHDCVRRSIFDLTGDGVLN